MRPRTLGETSLTVSPIGLGCWQFSQNRAYSRATWVTIDQDTITEIVRASLAGGVTWFDTAEAYGNGQSELTLSTALHRLRVHPGRVMIADKWLPVGRTATSITRTIGSRLRHLQKYPIGLYQIHQPWSLSPIREQMLAMAELVRAGKIGAVGVSNFSARQMEEASEALGGEGLSLASNQVPMSLLDRRVEQNGVLAAAKDLGVSLIAYSPLAQGLLSGKYHADPELVQALPTWRRLRVGRFGRVFGAHNLARTRPLIDELHRLAEAHDASISQVALAWLITYYGEMVVAIPGATRPAHATQNAGAMRVGLGEEELARIEAASARVARS